MKTIYLDMDGVLCDFEKRFVELFGCHTEESRAHKNTIYRQQWVDVVSGWHFATLDWFPGAQELISFVKSLPKTEVKILTSTAGDEFHNLITKQKMKWVTDRHLDIPVITVPGKIYKKLWANSESLLVDDTKKNINDFIKSGGKAILHTCADATINEIRSLYEVR